MFSFPLVTRRHKGTEDSRDSLQQSLLFPACSKHLSKTVCFTSKWPACLSACGTITSRYYVSREREEGERKAKKLHQNGKGSKSNFR